MGFFFTAPTLVAGSRAWFAGTYRGSLEERSRPVLRIKAGSTDKLRLLPSGIETFLVRNETALLLSLLGIALVLLVLSVGAGIRDAPDARQGSAS